MKQLTKRLAILLLAIVMMLAVTACGGSGETAADNGTGTEGTDQSGDVGAEGTEQSGESAGPATAAEGEKIINIGVTDSLGGVNPFAIDQTEINKYALDLMFLPLMELDKDLNFQGMLADSITTEDNINFIVHVDDKATWSDGTPVTA